MAKNTNYSDSNIVVLKGLEPVRKRPGMYIGSIDSTGLHHLIWEIFDNAVDEAIIGEANEIKITLKNDGSIQIEDNGRGIPTGINNETKLSTIDTVFTVLHSGGKFDDSAYKVSGGLHGVGASVVNALSSWLNVVVKKNGEIWESKYIDGGNIKQHTKKIGVTNNSGTCVNFLPDISIFKNITFKTEIIEERIRETSYLIKGLKIIYINELTSQTKEFYSEKGISEYVEFINENETKINNVAFFHGSEQTVEVEIAFQYTTNSEEIILSFANSIKTKNGGNYVTQFKSILTECINNIARKWNLLKDRDDNFTGEDIREGLTAIISVKVPEKIIQYKNQTKDELSTPEAGNAVKKIFADNFILWLEENRKVGEEIINKSLQSRNARIAAKHAREEIKKLNSTTKTSFKNTKLTPPQSKNYTENELFIVEGNSAGGTAKLARDKTIQGILPLRGKVINTEKARLKDILDNEEICSIIACVGTGIIDDFNIEHLKYDKIIIMTDADVDGSHIQILLLTFFYRFMKKLIETGHIYIAMPPLYKFLNTTNKKSVYVWDDNKLSELIKNTKHYEIQRYKGLGEMDANQLKETTMSKDSRQLIKVSIEDAILAEKKVELLMGDDSKFRKEWISQNIDFSIESE